MNSRSIRLGIDLHNQLHRLIARYVADGKRKKLIARAFYGTSLLDQINQAGDNEEVAIEILQEALDYGQLESGQFALVAFLQALREEVGVDVRKEIDQLIARVEQALQMPPPSSRPANTKSADLRNTSMKIFISYSSKDRTIAKKLAAQLRQSEFSAQIDQEFIQGGQSFSTALEQTLRASDAVLVLLSHNSVESRWVREETNTALELDKKVIPIRIEADVEPFFGIKTIQFIDMSDEDKWILNHERLIRTLEIHRASLYEISENKHTDKDDSLAANRLARNAQPFQAGNPFVYGSRVNADMFVGRESALNAIRQRLGGAAQLQSISIVGNRDYGKSSLLNYVAERIDELIPLSDAKWVPIQVDMSSARARTIPSIARMFRKKLIRALPLDLHDLLWDEADEEDPVSACEVIEETFSDLFDKGQYVVLLLDEWESVQARLELNTFIDSLRNSGSESRTAIITSTAHELTRLHLVTTDMSTRAGQNPWAVSRFYNIFEAHYLGLMSPDECQHLIEQAFNRSGVPVRQSDLNLIGALAGGHPKLTQLAGSIVWQGIKNGESENTLRANFRHMAEDTFVTLWHKETVELQQTVLRQILGLPTPSDVDIPANRQAAAIDELKRRGVLTQDGNVFSPLFADFIRELGDNDKNH